MIVGRSDRQTDGRTDRITITNTVQRIASHGKKQYEVQCATHYNRLQLGTNKQDKQRAQIIMVNGQQLSRTP